MRNFFGSWKRILSHQLVLGALLLLSGPALCQIPTSSPTFVPYKSNYCNQYSGNSGNTTNTDYQVACKGCLKAGCAYCVIDADDVKRNYCYSYSNPNDPTYGTCGDRNRIELAEDDRGENLSDDEYEDYCAGYDLGTLIVIIIFFYFLFPCCCAAIVVTLIMKLYKSTCAPDQRVHPGDEEGRPSGGTHIIISRDQHYYPQPHDPSPYANLQMADAKILTPRGAGGAGNGGTIAQAGRPGEEANQIPVVYAEAVPAIQHG